MIAENPTVFDSWCAGVDQISACMDIGSSFVGARVPTDYLGELRDLAEWHNEQVKAAKRLWDALQLVLDCPYDAERKIKDVPAIREAIENATR